MTNDEKAKAYDMALEAARKELGADRKEWEVVQQVLHNIFPQLRESEDERIRNDIMEAVENWLPYERVEDIRAYLEKQKEQKPVDYYHEMWKNCEANFEGGKKEVIEHPEKYGLQKPAEWSESDENMRDNILRVLSCFVGDSVCESNPSLSTSYPLYPLYQREIDWLKSLRRSWKPSEEQIEALRKAVNKLAKTDVADSISLSIMYDNLKKL